MWTVSVAERGRFCISPTFVKVVAADTRFSAAPPTKLTQSRRNQRLRGLAITLEGMILRAQGEYEAADNKYQLAYGIAKTGQNSRDIFMLSLNWGYLARLQGKYPAAYRLYTNALSKTVPAMRQHLILRSNIAEVLTWQGEYKEARDHLDRAFALLDGHDEQSIHAILLHDLGQLELREKRDTGKAQTHFEEGLAIAQAQNDVERIVQAQLALGDVYRRVGEREAAERAFTAALTLAQQTRNIADQTLATYGLAQLIYNTPKHNNVTRY